MGIAYRHYRNYDAPALMELWNKALTTRGCGVIAKPQSLEEHIFAKPWFDPAGLLVAIDEQDDKAHPIIGAALAGFGLDEQRRGLEYTQGVIPLVMVLPGCRRLGIGTTLLEQAERYLAEKGATSVQAGSSPDRCPYLWGMLGGSSPGGVLLTDVGAEPFLKARGYRQQDHFYVMRRSSNRPPPLGDPRFSAVRRKYEMTFAPRRVSNWIDEALTGAHQTIEFELLETAIGKPVAHLFVWDMELFAARTQTSQAGLYGMLVQPEFRGQGLGKYLVCLALQHLQEQMYGQVEAVVLADQVDGRSLLDRVGFTQIDEGWSYTKQLRP